MRLVWLAVALCACGGGAKAKPAAEPLPARAATAGDALLAYLPPGADGVAELDVARLRANPVVGELVGAVGPRAALGLDPLRDLDVVVIAAYRVAREDAATLFVVRGRNLDQVPNADRVDEQTVLVGPEALRARSKASLLDDDAFLRLRAAAMPEKAEGAALRMTVRLAGNARVAAAGKLALDEVPATLSLWADVADDAALVALLGGDDPADARRLAKLVVTAKAPSWLPARDEMRTEVRGKAARVVWVVRPKEFSAWVRTLEKRL
jgi:hypothetical protein